MSPDARERLIKDAVKHAVEIVQRIMQRAHEAEVARYRAEHADVWIPTLPIRSFPDRR